MVALGRERQDIVAITAAMLHPVGLGAFAKEFPERTFDVGIAEQHAAVSAAGLATAGLHPVVALYSTFLNRAFDQVLMDVALHRCGVTFVLDRAGVTGTDGPSHNGMWDLSILQVVPGLRLAAPRDADQLRALLREAVQVDDAPTVLRYPKAQVGPAVPALDRIGGVDLLRGSPAGGDVLLVAVGTTAGECLAAADLLAAQGVSATVVDPRWVKPVDPALAVLARSHRLVVTVVDGGRASGVGSAVAQSFRDAGVDVPTRDLGIPQEFLTHAARGEILERIGLTGPGIAARTAAELRRLHRPAAAAPRTEAYAPAAGVARTRGGDPDRGI
jgi:1-deoxy-D-xylulose-5-phosphate synthase